MSFEIIDRNFLEEMDFEEQDITATENQAFKIQHSFGVRHSFPTASYEPRLSDSTDVRPELQSYRLSPEWPKDKTVPRKLDPI